MGETMTTSGDGALEEERLDYALDLYRKGETTIGKAAEMAKKRSKGNDDSGS